jgi:hypothetical protein
MEEFEDKSNSDINGTNTSLIDYELIENWLSYARQLGLTEIEILGMAYFNSAIPTILFHIEQDNSIIKPLGLPEITKRLSVVLDIFGGF